MPNPPINKTRNRAVIHKKMMAFRVRPDQKEKWEAAAAAKGMDLSEWMRCTLDREARKK